VHQYPNACKARQAETSSPETLATLPVLFHKLKPQYQRFRRGPARRSRPPNLSGSHIFWQFPELLLFRLLAYNRASARQKFSAADQGSCIAAAKPPPAHVRAETSFPKLVQRPSLRPFATKVQVHPSRGLRSHPLFAWQRPQQTRRRRTRRYNCPSPRPSRKSELNR